MVDVFHCHLVFIGDLSHDFFHPVRVFGNEAPTTGLEIDLPSLKLTNDDKNYHIFRIHGNGWYIYRSNDISQTKTKGLAGKSPNL